MKRAQLDDLIVAATTAIQQNTVIIIGSQAILASLSETELPSRATMSTEADMIPLNDDALGTSADILDAAIGELSEYDRDNQVYAQGVQRTTMYAPEGWEKRLVAIHPPGRPDLTGLCLEPHDLCATKLARFDEKDKEFVGALVDAGLVQSKLIRARLDGINDQRFTSATRRAALHWLRERPSSPTAIHPKGEHA